MLQPLLIGLNCVMGLALAGFTYAMFSFAHGVQCDALVQACAPLSKYQLLAAALIPVVVAAILVLSALRAKRYSRSASVGLLFVGPVTVFSWLGYSVARAWL